MTSLRVLVTDGQLRPSLAVVRSLGRAGHQVFVCGPRKRNLAGASRYSGGQAQVSDPLSDPARYADDVVALTRDWKIDVLIPMSEEAMLVLLPAAAAMPGVMIPFAPLETFRQASDKELVTRMAPAVGIDVPRQVVLPSADAWKSSGALALQFPVVLKPARSVGGADGTRQKMSVTYATTSAEASSMIAELPAAAFPLLVQEQIVGPGTAVFLLLWKGELIARFAHRRIREKPPSGGVSVCAESVAADSVTVEKATALLKALGWSGPAMVEFKQDAATGRLYLMEINGRFWGSLQLAIDAGVDFPALLVAAAAGEAPQPVTRYQEGVITRWWWGEVDHVLAVVRGRGTGATSRFGVFRRLFLPERGARNEVLRATDPWPAVRETIDWLQGR